MSSNSINVETPHEVTVGVNRLSLTVSLTGAASLDADVEANEVAFSGGRPTLSFSGGDPVEVEVSALSTLSATVGAQGPAGASGTGQESVFVRGFNTSGVASWRMVYASGDYTVTHTDAGAFPGAKALGAFDGQLGKVQTEGVASLTFLVSSPTPVAGTPVFLARADAEAGADGKVSATPPAEGFVGLVGLVVNVPITFTSNRRAEVLLRIGGLTKRGG